MPRILGEGEYPEGSGFGTLEADEYRCEIIKFEEKEQKPEYAKPGGSGKSIWFYLTPLAQVDDPDAELVDKDTGEPISPDKTLVFFYDPDRTGLVPVIAKSRKFIAAALNVPVEEPIEFEGYEDLVGKQVICSVIVKNGNNRIDAVRAAKKKAPAKQPVAVAAAKEVFGEDVVRADTDY